MSERRQRVSDEGALHKYRTEIPNTIIRGVMGRGLTLPARWLYVYLKSVAGDCGECWQNMTTLAAGAQLSRGGVSKARRELIDANLIVVAKGKGALHETDRIRILDIWDQNMSEFRTEPSSPGERAPSSLHESEDKQEVAEIAPSLLTRVHQVNAPSSSGERASSLHEQPSSPGEPKKISLKKIPEKKEDLPPVSTNVETSPKGTARPAKEKRPKRFMPKEEKAQQALAASILDDKFEQWHRENYPDVDVAAQWVYFVNYCLSSGRQYADFRAAFMNSFPWENSPAQRPLGSTNHQHTVTRPLSFAEQRLQRKGNLHTWVEEEIDAASAGPHRLHDRPRALRDGLDR